MNERLRMWAMLAIAAAVLIASALMIFVLEGVNAWTLASFVILLLIVAVALFFVMRTAKELRSGYPLEDERSRYLNMRAGYYSFYISMYVVLGLAFVMMLLQEEGVVLSNNEVLFFIVILMGSVHIVLTTYFKRKGKASIE